MSRKSIWTLAALAVVLVVMLPAFNVSLTNSAVLSNVDNESITVDYSNSTSVDKADAAFEILDNESIRQDGQNLNEGDDYEFNTSSGEVTWLNSTKTTDGGEASIDYSYRAPTEQTRDVNTILSTAVGTLPYMLVFVGGAVVVGLLKVFGGGSGGR